jgi:Lectin C-type domain
MEESELGGGAGAGAAGAAPTGGTSGGLGGAGGENAKGEPSCDGLGEYTRPSSQHCYRFVHSDVQAWAAAREICIEWGGDLAAFDSMEELLFVSEKPGTPEAGQPDGKFWVGGNRIGVGGIANEWAWSSGETWSSVLPWSSGDPSPDSDRDCVNVPEYTIENNYCTNEYPFLCEKSLP